MSYQTDAERAIDQAREHTQEIVKALAHIVVEECERHADFRIEFRMQISEAFEKAIALRDLLR